MGNKKRTKMLLFILVCIILSACGQKKEDIIYDTEEPDYSVCREPLLDTQKAYDEADADEQKNSDETYSDESKNADEHTESIGNNFTSRRYIEIIPAKKADIPKTANESGRTLTAEEFSYLMNL